MHRQTRTSFHLFALGSLTALLALLGAGCGDDDGGSNNNTNQQSDASVSADAYVPDPLGDPIVQTVTGGEGACHHVFIDLTGSGAPAIVCVSSGMGDYSELYEWDGAAWTTDHPSGSSVGAFLLDNTGAPQVAYTYLSSEMQHVFEFARRDSGTWGEVIVDTTTFTPDYELDLAQDAAGTLHVAYQDLNLGDGAGHGGLKYASSDATMFEAEVVDDPTAATSDVGITPRIAVASNGDVHVAYGVEDTSTSERTLRYAVRRGGTWTLEDVPTTYATGRELHLLLDSAGAPHILCGDGVFWLRRSGGTWTETMIRDAFHDLLAARLDSRDGPNLLVKNNSGLYFLRPSGSGFEEIELLTATATYGAAFVLTSADVPHIALGLHTEVSYVHFEP